MLKVLSGNLRAAEHCYQEALQLGQGIDTKTTGVAWMIWNTKHSMLRTMQSLLLPTLLYRKICRTRNNEIMTKDLSTLLLCLSFLGICHVWFSLPQCWPVRPKVFLMTWVFIRMLFSFTHLTLNDRLCCEWCRCIGMMLKSFYRMFWKIMALSERAATVTALRHCFCRHSFFWDSWPWRLRAKVLHDWEI